MMEENKYYTPDLEDLCVGFVHEYLGWSGKWVESEIEKYYNCSDMVNASEALIEGRIRVPYLTKEQIESEGFEWLGSFQNEDNSMWNHNFKIYSKDISLRYKSFEKQLEISIVRNTVFKGKCRCINDFRKILKLLEIK